SFEVNVLGGLRAARAAVPFMRRQGRGRIIFIASVYGRESGGRPGYNIAKAAEISLSKALSRELAADSILVNSVAPGSLMFPGISNVIAVPIGAVGASSGRLAVDAPSTMAIGSVPKGATLTMPIGVTLMSYVTLSSGAFSVR